MAKVASSAWRNGVIAAVHASAASRDADPAPLLDSLEFIDSLDDLVDVNPAVDWFEAAIDKKVQAALERSPGRFLARPPVDPWLILQAIYEYVLPAGRFKEVQPIRDLLRPAFKDGPHAESAEGMQHTQLPRARR